LSIDRFFNWSQDSTVCFGVAAERYSIVSAVPALS
jgi:hypothetical protein